MTGPHPKAVEWEVFEPTDYGAHRQLSQTFTRRAEAIEFRDRAKVNGHPDAYIVERRIVVVRRIVVAKALG